jgi:RNA polymerase sigma-70 factor (ECF subfamily)
MSPSNHFDHDVEEMARLLRHQDKAAFDWLLAHFERLVFSILRRYFTEDEDVRDQSQEVWTKVWNKWPGAPPDQKFRPWLLTVTKNTAIDELRRRNGNRPPGEFDLNQIPEREPDADDIDHEYEKKIYEECKQQLTDEERIILNGKLAGKSSKEIGKEIGRPPGTVDAMWFKIQLKLCRCALRKGRLRK